MNRLKIPLALFFAIFFWASAFIGIRVGLHGYTPGSMALLRFLVASICMAILYQTLPEQRLTLRDKFGLFSLGVTGIGIYNTCLNYGELPVTAGVASFIIGLIPVFSILLSVFFLKERPSAGVWAGIDKTEEAV